jgi:arginyl-tRNA synthetase
MYVYTEIINEVVRSIASLLSLPREDVEKLVTDPPSHVPYDLSFPVMRFKLSESALQELVRELRMNELISEVSVERVYLNIRFSRDKLAARVLQQIINQKERYGSWPTRDEVIVVEHTSANPVHPLHIGHGRNMAIGDSLVRILANYGYKVQSRFYINDLGRQVAVLGLGVSCLGEKAFLDKNMKSDHWFGLIYALTNQLLELKRLKGEREKSVNDTERYIELTSQIDEVVANIARLSEKSPELFEALSDCIMNMDNPESAVQLIMSEYERGDARYKELMRRMITEVLSGFKETMSKLRVNIDYWDYESELVWSGEVDEIIHKIRKSPLYTIYKGAEALSVDKIAIDPEIRRKLRIPEGLEIPPLVIRRSDGTTLYVTRDIAYTIRKFRESNAKKVINVVAKEQLLPQAQLRLALYSLGYTQYAENLIHYVYEMVILPGTKMSGRAGTYVSLDDILKELVALSKAELYKRYGQQLSKEEIESYSQKIAVAALRYSLVNVEPDKQLVFKEEDVLNFERNSAPYLLYSYARAYNVLKKIREEELPREQANYAKLVEDETRYRLVKLLAKYPLVTKKAAEELRIEYLTSYLWRVSQEFNQWYDRDPILKETDKELFKAKIELLIAFTYVMKNALELLGIEPLERL